MNKNEIKNLLEFICPVLVLSYFIIHSIFIVFIGILLSTYLINIPKIKKYSTFIHINRYNRYLSKNLRCNDVSVDSEPIIMNFSQHESNLKLVEIVEESGFIPSVDNNEDMNAA